MADLLNKDNYPYFLNDYLRYLRTILGRSENTVIVYSETISELLHFLQYFKLNSNFDAPINKLDAGFLKTISLTDLYEYLYYIDLKKSNSSSTRAKKVSAVKSFFKFLTSKENILTVNPAIELSSPKIKKTLPKYLKLDEALKLLNSVNGTYKERDYAIILLFLTCGMRLSELVNINIKDIRSQKLVITGKGNKERTVYLSEPCENAINAYLKVRPKEGVIDREALFISRNNRRISRRMVQTIVEKYLKAAGLDGMNFSTHKLRHTAATLMYQEGNVDIRLLQEILGHTNLSTTEIYTHVSNEQLKTAIDSNPLSKIK